MAGGSGAIFIEGFLIKRGHRRHNWKTRWFKLSEASLRYYKDQKHKVPHGRIPLENAVLTKNAELGNGDAARINVFIVKTASGVDYPIQAGTTEEFNIWTDSIQKVINTLDPTKSIGQPQAFPQQSGVVKSNAADERRKAELLNQEGSKASAIGSGKSLQNQVVSGAELRRWTEGVLGVGRTEAEDAIKTLVQVGFIECLSSDAHELSLYDNSQYFRMLTDETSLKNMSTSYLTNLKSNSSTSTSKSQQRNPGPHGYCLPSDLPPGDVVKRGILFKRGHIVPSWKARCFVLQEFPATLSYFDPTKKNLKTINSLSLHGATAFPVTKEAAEGALKISNPPDHLFCVKTDTGALYLIIGSTEQEKNEWIEAITTLCRKKKEPASA